MIHDIEQFDPSNDLSDYYIRFDDKYDLSATKKLFINFFVIFFIILLDENLIVRELNFSFFENKIELRNISTLFTILCFLLLINALNMFDANSRELVNTKMFAFLNLPKEQP